MCFIYANTLIFARLRYNAILIQFRILLNIPIGSRAMKGMGASIHLIRLTSNLEARKYFQLIET